MENHRCSTGVEEEMAIKPPPPCFTDHDDLLAPLSDLDGEVSSRSSWSSEESLDEARLSSIRPRSSRCNFVNNVNDNYLGERSDVSADISVTIDWRKRCVCLHDEFIRYQESAERTKELFQYRLSELEQRVTEAESRAVEAEDKVRLMEERLVQSTEWSSGSEPGSGVNELNGSVNGSANGLNGLSNLDNDTAINKLASQVEEQRQLRLHDAKLVEAKAAKIKEWVTNKLKDLEAQNQHLREQNHKCNQQLELLKKHMAQLSAGRLAEASSLSQRSSRPTSLQRMNKSEPTFLEEREPIYAQIDRMNKTKHNCTGGDLLAQSRYLSACNPQTNGEVVTNGDAHSSSHLSYIRPKSENGDACDQCHDYAEIYTPSKENANWVDGNKPPTPPLHRFPSWESRIYQIANDGLSASLPSHMDHSSKFTVSSHYSNTGYCNLSCPVYATVKGRISQIRSSPFSGESTDESSDGEDHAHHMNNVGAASGTNSSVDNTDYSITSSSPSKSQKTTSSTSPLKRTSSPYKNTSLESGISDDYAIPPDAMSCGEDSTDWSSIAITTTTSPSHNGKAAVPELCFEKYGYLVKLGGKLKTWRRRWFHLDASGKLRYWKTQSEINKKPRGEISIDELCKIKKSEGGTTFEISTAKKTYYLTADSIPAMEDWIKVLQNVQRRNAMKLLLSKENYKPTLQGWLTKVRNGHAKKCWCILIGKMFLYFKSQCDKVPIGQINMKESKVEQLMEHLSDSDSDDKDADCHDLTIGILPVNQPPTYLLMTSKQELDSWLYHLTIVSGGAGSTSGTQYEQLVQKLMETEGDPDNVLWKHPSLLHTKEIISSALTTLPSESLQAEAVKLFKCGQLFMSVAVETAGIDYHVVLAQNALQQCLENVHLQSELICSLIKQTSPHSAHKLSSQVLNKLRHRQLLLCASQSLFACDAANSPTAVTSPPIPIVTSADNCKANPPTFVFLQGWQLLALAVSLFVPKDHRILWYLKCHLRRNAETRTECGKYATYCERALERTIENGNRKAKPSRMEVLSILLKNPYHHSLPHSIPVHFRNNTYQVIGFDGSTKVEEFLISLTKEIGCRPPSHSGFTLFSDDPIERDLQHYIDPQTKLCDVISKWETALRHKGSGKFENTKVIQLMYKNRLYFRYASKYETDKERLLLCYQTNHQIINGRFPLTKELAIELSALMAQIDLGEIDGEKNKGGNNSKDLLTLQAIDKYYPRRYKDNLSPEALKELQNIIQNKWSSLKGRATSECVRIYMTCTRKWPYFGASLFQAKWKQGPGVGNVVWLAASEDGLAMLELGTMQTIATYSYRQVLTFGGCQDDFMLVISTEDGLLSQKFVFSLSKPNIFELTLVIADYMNALGQLEMSTLGGTLNYGTLNRGTPSSTGTQPDILKATPDHQSHRSDCKKYQFDG